MPSPLDQSLHSAFNHHQAGRLDEAETLCKQVLAAQPARVDALHLCAIIAAQTGRNELAASLFRQAIAAAPNIPELHCNLGTILQNLAQRDEAIVYYHRAIALKPDYADAHFNLGVALANKGQLDAAIESYERSLKFNPNNPQVLCNLGSLWQKKEQDDQAIVFYQRAISLEPNSVIAHNNLGGILVDEEKLDQALPHLERAVDLQPDYPEAHFNLGNLWWHRKEFNRAIASYQKALSLKPDYVEAYFHLAPAYTAIGQTALAIATCRKALELKPDCVEAMNNMGAALVEEGQNAQAMACYQQAIAIKPDFAAALCNLGTALQLNRQIDRAFEFFQKSIAVDPKYPEAHINLGNSLKEFGKLDDAIASYRKALALDPSSVTAHDNLVFGLLYHPDYFLHASYAESRNWNRVHAEPLARFVRLHVNDRDPDRRLRVGYVSPDFRTHVVMQCFLPLLSNHNHENVEIFCYANVPRPDATTEILRGHADAWRDIVRMTDEEVADMIRQDRIDILVDLAGHTAGNRLLVFAYQPAPIQITYQGYPATSGLTAMTHRMTDAFADPPGMTESFHSEQMIRLPRAGWSWRQPKDSPDLAPMPALATGHVTFGSFNHFAKINPPLLKLWAEILHAAPKSRLQINGSSLGYESVRRRVLEIMHNLGIESHRLDLRPPAPEGEYYPRYNQTDIALDTYPYHGTTTTFDTLWMSVPMITLAGPSHISRVGVSLLTQLGLTDLVAQTPSDYIRIAADLARDLPRLADLRSQVRPRMLNSPLMDCPSFARDVENAYRTTWRTWCDNH
jgi:protein O-GlcNAc transferase